MVWQYWG